MADISAPNHAYKLSTTMPKIIIIGECNLEVTFPADSSDSWPLLMTGRPGGCLLNAAAMLGRKGMQVSFVADAARDSLGDLLVRYLDSCNVDTHCIDRYSDGGVTSSDFIFPATDAIITNRRFPVGENFNCTWPRIDHDDLVVFGGFFALDDRSRPQVMEMVSYAAERKATVIYVPGFVPSLVPRITRVMPAILENLELADIVYADTADLRTIWNETSPDECYRRNINFYCRTLLCADTPSKAVTLHYPGGKVSADITATCRHDSLRAAAGLAALIGFIADRDITREQIDLGLTCQQSDEMISIVARSISDSED